MIERVDAIWFDLENVRQIGPLTGYISGCGTMNVVANMLLAVGAAPKYILFNNDIGEAIAICDSVFISCDTARLADVETFEQVMAAARKLEVPVIFDPAGIESEVEVETIARRLLNECPPDVIRCTAPQLQALHAIFVKEGEQDISGMMPLDIAKELSDQLKCIFVITGEESYVVKGNDVSEVRNGSPMMWRNVNTGIYTTALLSVFCGINPDLYQAALNATFFSGICAEMATQNSDGPGTYAPQLLDAMANMMKPDILLR